MTKYTVTKCKYSISVIGGYSIREPYLRNKFWASTKKGINLPTKFKLTIKSTLLELENVFCYLKDFVIFFTMLCQLFCNKLLMIDETL